MYEMRNYSVSTEKIRYWFFTVDEEKQDKQTEMVKPLSFVNLSCFLHVFELSRCISYDTSTQENYPRVAEDATKVQRFVLSFHVSGV